MKAQLRTERVFERGPSPSAALSSAGADDRPFALVSGPGDPSLSRWSYGALEAVGHASDLAAATRAIVDWPSAATGGPAFCGGAVGFIGYDFGFSCVKKPRPVRPDPLGLPSASFSLYDAIYARDERSGEGWLCWHDTPDADARAKRLLGALGSSSPAPVGSTPGTTALVTQAAYGERVRALLDAIHSGDLYQANLSYAREGSYHGAPAAAFLRLERSPPPFSAFLDLGASRAIVSASMECFFDLDGVSGSIASYPIKGTRPRGGDASADAELARALAASEKDRAEHLMIVDLIRNDLSRVAAAGTVRVDRLAYVEPFPTVLHLTSRIEARLLAGLSVPELLGALFPGGSITGAPKLRAMEMIDELEGEARGVYTGAILYASPDGSIRSSVAIRTASFAGSSVRYGVGGGVVADSTAELEWDETIVKATALEQALRGSATSIR